MRAVVTWRGHNRRRCHSPAMHPVATIHAVHHNVSSVVHVHRPSGCVVVHPVPLLHVLLHGRHPRLLLASSAECISPNNTALGSHHVARTWRPRHRLSAGRQHWCWSRRRRRSRGLSRGSVRIEVSTTRRHRRSGCPGYRPVVSVYRHCTPVCHCLLRPRRRQRHAHWPWLRNQLRSDRSAGNKQRVKGAGPGDQKVVWGRHGTKRTLTLVPALAALNVAVQT